MSFRDQFRKKKNDLTKWHHESQQTGARFGSIFIKDKIPEGVEHFRHTEGVHCVDILPFILSNNYIKTINSKAVAGDIVYKLDLFLHTSVGYAEAVFVCPWENYGEPCPICEVVTASRKSGQRMSKEDYKRHKAKRTGVYLIWVHDTPKDEAKGVQIFQAQHYFIGENLEEISKLPQDGEGGYILFEDIDEGKSFMWTKKGVGQGNVKVYGHKLIDRKMPIPDEILNKIFPLDTCVKFKATYKEIEKAYLFEGASSEEETGRGQDDDLPPSVEDDRPPWDTEDVKPPDMPPPKEEAPPEESGDEFDTDLCFGISHGDTTHCELCPRFDDCFEVITKRARQAIKGQEPPQKKEPKKETPKEEAPKQETRERRRPVLRRK